MTTKLLSNHEINIPDSWNDISFVDYVNLFKYRECVTTDMLEIDITLNLFILLCNPPQEVLDNITVPELADISNIISKFLINEKEYKEEDPTFFTYQDQLYSYSRDFDELGVQELKAIQASKKKYPHDMIDIVSILVRESTLSEDQKAKRIPFRQSDVENRKQIFLTMPWDNFVGPINFFLTNIVPLIASMDKK